MGPGQLQARPLQARNSRGSIVVAHVPSQIGILAVAEALFLCLACVPEIREREGERAGSSAEEAMGSPRETAFQRMNQALQRGLE